MGRQGVAAGLSRMAARALWQRMPRHHRGMPERHPRCDRFMVPAADAAERASGLVGEPQASGGGRRSDLTPNRFPLGKRGTKMRFIRTALVSPALLAIPGGRGGLR